MSLFNIGLSIVGALLRGYVLVVMWGWFVLSQFVSAPHLSMAGALGLSVALSVFHPSALGRQEYVLSQENDLDFERKYVTWMNFVYILSILILWFAGWIIHMFM